MSWAGALARDPPRLPGGAGGPRCFPAPARPGAAPAAVLGSASGRRPGCCPVIYFSRRVVFKNIPFLPSLRPRRTGRGRPPRCPRSGWGARGAAEGSRPCGAPRGKRGAGLPQASRSQLCSQPPSPLRVAGGLAGKREMSTWLHLLRTRSHPGNRPHLGGRGKAALLPGYPGPCEPVLGGQRAPRG